MKDKMITSEQKRKVLKNLLICFIIANALNVYAIVTQNASWKELYTSFHIVLIVTVFLYAFYAMLRLIWNGTQKMMNK